jgi:hypothetical protein
VLRDPARGVYKRVVLRQNRIVGAVLYGDTADGSRYFDLLKQRADITSNRDMLIFGQAYQGGGALDPKAAIAALSDVAEICGCDGVCCVSRVCRNTNWPASAIRYRASFIRRCQGCPGADDALQARQSHRLHLKAGTGWPGSTMTADGSPQRPHCLTTFVGSFWIGLLVAATAC